jgi:hypothetical protein
MSTETLERVNEEENFGKERMCNRDEEFCVE